MARQSSQKKKPRKKSNPRADTSGVGDSILANGGAFSRVILDSPPPVPIDSATQAKIDQFGAIYPFSLDDFQQQAIAALLDDSSVMVAAPTGTGKTVVAEFGIYDSFRRTGRVFYTTPIKALSNQKYRDLRQLYRDQIGLLTGDVSENRDARTVVMTTEVLRNMLLQTPWDLDDVDAVIFDEIHFLADPDRGTTWEESIILCPEHVQLICLSATVSNADEIAEWIGRTHRPTRLITHVNRAVPLSLYYFVKSELHQVVDHEGVQLRDFPRTGGEARRRNGGRGRRSESNSPGTDEPLPHEIVGALAERDMLPAIYFLFSRNDCQVFAERLALMRSELVGERQAADIETVLGAYLRSLRPEDRELEQVQLIVSLARRGIGFHHAGLLPVLKQLVEVLFDRGLMQVVFATDTLALGVNMPARSVVIGRMSKWDGRRRRTLTSNEFQQMAGRAGRRGMDEFGHVIVPYSPWLSFREMIGIATGPLEPVRSAFAVRYNTVLNLWDPPDGDRVRSMLRQSLAQFQTNQRIRRLEDDIIEIGGDISGIPKGCLIGFDDGDDLLEEYRLLTGTMTTADQKLKRIEEQEKEVRNSADRPPWQMPTRQALRRMLRHAKPGIVVHDRDRGWAVFLHGSERGVGWFAFEDGVDTIPEYRRIDFVPESAEVDLPESIQTRDSWDDGDDAGRVVAGNVASLIWENVRNLSLPDLERVREDHRTRELDRIGEELAQLEIELTEAREQSASLRRSRMDHPCHSCDRRKEHRGYLNRIDRLERERQSLQDVLERESEAEDLRIRGVIRGIREVLHRFGYMHRGYPTEKADMLASVFDNDALILCELVSRKMLDSLDPADLAEVCSWFSFDRDFRYSNHFTLPPHLVDLRRRLEDMEHIILGEERDHGMFISEGHNPTFYGAVRAWALGATMSEVAETIELSEGDLVMTINKTIDLLRQIREMLEDVVPDSPLVPSLISAEQQLKRDIVAQSLTLGYAPIFDTSDSESSSDSSKNDKP